LVAVLKVAGLVVLDLKGTPMVDLQTLEVREDVEDHNHAAVVAAMAAVEARKAAAYCDSQVCRGLLTKSLDVLNGLPQASEPRLVSNFEGYRMDHLMVYVGDQHMKGHYSADATQEDMVVDLPSAGREYGHMARTCRARRDDAAAVVDPSCLISEKRYRYEGDIMMGVDEDLFGGFGPNKVKVLQPLASNINTA
jgi:hypothetical protein